MPKKKNEDKMLIFRCNTETIFRIKTIAAIEGRSVSAQIRHMIESYPIKGKFAKAAKAVLEVNARARPTDIIKEATRVKAPVEEGVQDEPPPKPSRRVPWWLEPSRETAEIQESESD